MIFRYFVDETKQLISQYRSEGRISYLISYFLQRYLKTRFL